MKPVNTEFVRQLEEVTTYLQFGSESDSCFKPFVWEVNERGTLTLEKLLQSEGFLSYVKANDLLEFVSSEASWSDWGSSTPSEVALEMSFKYAELINFLNSHLKSLEIYLVSNLGAGDPNIRREKVKRSRIGNPKLYSLSVNQLYEYYKRGETCVEQEAFHILVGETFEGEWLGIVPKMWGESSKRGGKMFLLPEASLNENTIDLKRRLEAFAKELEFSVVECLAFYRKKEAVVEAGSIKDELLYRLLSYIKFFRIFTFVEYSSQDSHNSERFRPLDELLKSNLPNIQEYIIGLNARYFIYSVGRTIEGDWIGVSTRATWT